MEKTRQKKTPVATGRVCNFVRLLYVRGGPLVVVKCLQWRTIAPGARHDGVVTLNIVARDDHVQSVAALVPSSD
jgi:hypothetical protein